MSEKQTFQAWLEKYEKKQKSSGPNLLPSPIQLNKNFVFSNLLYEIRLRNSIAFTI